MDSAVAKPEPEVRVSVRLSRGEVATTTWGELSAELVEAACPWRTVRHAHGHAHHPGWAWSERAGRHVMFESRLERARLVEAEFDPSVRNIKEQPFLFMIRTESGRLRRHIPDFLLLHLDRPPLLVNVKPPGWESNDQVRQLFDAVECLCALRGWAYETWTGSSRLRRINLDWLAGYRRRATVPATDEELEALLGLVTGPMSIGQLEAAGDRLMAECRPAILHLLWTRALQIDVDQPLDVTSEVWR